MENNQVRDSFSSKFGILAAAAGSAIGLGNIWKFPYITGENGGAAFIIVYLLCIAIIGLPVMLSEFLIGRRAQKNAVGSFMTLKPGTPWFLTGWMGLLSALFILSFYGVVAGWTMNYMFWSITGKLAGATPEVIGNTFGGFITNATQPLIWQVLFMAATALIVWGGIKDGIERYSKILMPMLLVIILIIDVRAMTLPGSGAGVEFLISPKFGDLSIQGVLVALGHAFFSLSLGMGTMITYGSYIGKKENLGTMALQVTIADTAIALLAGFAIFPAVFAFGIEPSAGPGLVFVTLPNVFNQMPGGYIFSILFFFLLFVAALTSSISILEVVVAYFAEELKMKRHVAILVSTIGITLSGVLCSLSMSPDSFVSAWQFPTFGGMKNFFDTLDWWSANMFLPLGGLFISLFVGYAMKKEDVKEEVTNGGTLSAPWVDMYIFVSKTIAPVAIFFVFLYSLGVIKF